MTVTVTPATQKVTVTPAGTVEVDRTDVASSVTVDLDGDSVTVVNVNDSVTVAAAQKVTVTGSTGGASVTATSPGPQGATGATGPTGPAGDMGGHFDVTAYGAVGDGVTDDYPAFQDALDAIAGLGDGYSSGNAVPFPYVLYVPCEVPEKSYYCSQGLVIDRPGVAIHGDGTYGAHGPRIEFPAGVTGIHLDGSAALQCEYPAVRGIGLKARAKTTPNCHGILVEAHGAVLEDVYVTGFSGHGIYVNSSDIAPNANNFEINRATVEFNNGDGLRLQGTNANAGMVRMVDAENNGGWGINDSSFLGNTFIACHSAFNTTGAYTTTGPVAWSLWLNCYSEGGQPPAEFAQRSLIIGGDHGAGFGNDTQMIQAELDERYGTAIITSPIVVPVNVDEPRVAAEGGGTASVRLGSWSPDKRLLGFSIDGYGNVDFAAYDGTGAQGGLVVLQANNSSSYQGFLIVLPNAKDFENVTIGGDDTTRIPAGMVGFPGVGFFIKERDNSKIIKYNSGRAAPASGTWARGDVVFNSTPSAGGWAGWICTSGGTPGTWKGFGQIEA